MTGTAKETQLCGKIVKLGDYVEVDYESGGGIKGEIVELWGLKEDGHLQGRVKSGWCFHDNDTITKHELKPVDEVFPGTNDALQKLTIMADSNKQ